MNDRNRRPRLRVIKGTRGTLLCPVPSKNGGQSLTPPSLRCRTCDHLPAHRAWAELPETPDSADDVALQRTEGFTRCLAFLTTSCEVGTRLLRVLTLRKNDAVENPVELPVTAAVEAVAHEPGRGGLERCRAGISRPTLATALRGKPVRARTAWKLARALEQSPSTQLSQLLAAA